MREANAVYGGEMSAHHYFRDFMFCDSGTLPWLMVLSALSQSGTGLAAMVQDMRVAFPSSGELNFRVSDPEHIKKTLENELQHEAQTVDHFDCRSMAFDTWRFNLRVSSTEPRLRLNH
ncbi:MAG: hypothetical protein AAGF94_08070 [Pseudomonadota bacterium]